MKDVSLRLVQARLRTHRIHPFRPNKGMSNITYNAHEGDTGILIEVCPTPADLHKHVQLASTIYTALLESGLKARLTEQRIIFVPFGKVAEPGTLTWINEGGATVYETVQAEKACSTKAEKLVKKGIDKPAVARAAEATADMLVRASLGQATLFAEAFEQAFPRMSAEELTRAASFFLKVSTYFQQRAKGDIPTSSPWDAIRNWSHNSPEFIEIVQILAIVACPQSHCDLNGGC